MYILVIDHHENDGHTGKGFAVHSRIVIEISIIFKCETNDCVCVGCVNMFYRMDQKRR